MFYSLFCIIRRRTRLRYGTTFSPTSIVLVEMRSLSWHRRVLSAMLRVVLLRGSLSVFFRLSEPASSLVIEMPTTSMQCSSSTLSSCSLPRPFAPMESKLALWYALLTQSSSFIAHRYIQSSFGFGQVGGTILVLHPRYLFGALEPSLYEEYKMRNRVRALASFKAMSDMMITNSLVKIKDAPPYSAELEVPVLLNSRARATFDAKTGKYGFTSKLDTKPKHDLANAKAVSDILSIEASVSGVGVDQGKYYFSFFIHTSNPSLQSSSLPFLHGTRPSLSATSPMPKSLTAASSPRRRHH
jgi:hypothetical protein